MVSQVIKNAREGVFYYLRLLEQSVRGELVELPATQLESFHMLRVNGE